MFLSSGEVIELKKYLFKAVDTFLDLYLAIAKNTLQTTVMFVDIAQ